MTHKPRELILLSRAHSALAKARTIDEVKDLRSKAEAVKAYVSKARLGKHILVEASAIKVQAERKLGQMLQETELASAAPGNQYTDKAQPSEDENGSLRLADLGITKSDSSRLQQVASLPDDVFSQYLTDSVSAERELTTAALLRLAKQQRVASTESDEVQLSSSGVVKSLTELVSRKQKFATIYADPPWPYTNQATRAATGNHYPAMSVERICAEPVEQLCQDRAHLHLWTTNAFLPQAFDVIEAWGFTYKSCFVWVKPQIGIGNYWRVSHEFLLLGVRGSLTFADRSQRSWIELERTQHSRKPPAVRKIIEQVSPAPYLEMYGREDLADSSWTVYGNQVHANGHDSNQQNEVPRSNRDD